MTRLRFPLLLFAVILPALGWASEESPTSTLVDEGIYVRLVDGREVALEALPERGEGYLALARRITGEARLSSALQQANDGRPLFAGVPAKVPWPLVREEYRYLALRALFPGDRPSERGWLHRPKDARVAHVGIGLWQLGEWFTESGETWDRIAAANGIAGPDLQGRESVLIPHALLRPIFRFEPSSADGALSFGEDDEGPYAEYRLKRGEALYSAVVLRYTPIIAASEDGMTVDQAVEIIAARSQIEDVRDIEVDYPVRIPLDLLSQSLLPSNHPRRVLARVRQSEIAAIELPSRPSGLDGVHVLIDSGHGGKDTGARHNGVWESAYVYDVACRVKRLLKRESSAEVHMLVKDLEHGFAVKDSRRLPKNGREILQTTPPMRLDLAVPRRAVNMRWYLANSIHDTLRKRGVDSDKIVFLSLHADALHRSIRGAMVYVPGVTHRRSKNRVKGSVYEKYREYTPKLVTFSRNERLRDEKLSTRLGRSLLDGFEDEELRIHDNKPLRTYIVRKLSRRRPASRFVPAVLQGNKVPAKVLLELVNLNNAEDADLIASPEGRERLARAIVKGLHNYYSGE